MQTTIQPDLQRVTGKLTVWDVVWISHACRRHQTSRPTAVWKRFGRANWQREDEQELSSCWDGRPFSHKRHGPKSRGCCAPLRRGSWVPF